MRTRLIITAAAAVVTACGSPPRYDYVKEGASAYQRTDAKSECEYQIRLNKTLPAEQPKLMQLCMQGKGYRLKQVN